MSAQTAALRRPVDAALLRRCCNELRDRVDRHGVRLRKPRLRAPWTCPGWMSPSRSALRTASSTRRSTVEGAQLYELGLTGCARLPGLLANGVRIRRDLDLSRTHVTGALRTSASTSKRSAVWLCESEIGGRLLCVDTVIDGGAERSIQADRMHVGGNIRLLHKFTARGEVRLIGARIGGSLDLTGASIESPVTGLALDLGEAVIEGSVFLIDDTPAGGRLSAAVSTWAARASAASSWSGTRRWKPPAAYPWAARTHGLGPAALR